MSEEQLKAFLEKVKADASLQEKLKAAADVEAVIAIAKVAGFTITSNDLSETQSEMSEEELEAVAGGKCEQNSACVHGNIWAGEATKHDPSNKDHPYY